jgi:predicted N-formylglutamate amidohydrolase
MPLVQQNYSRLVIDCNRTPGSETSIPETGEFMIGSFVRKMGSNAGARPR